MTVKLSELRSAAEVHEQNMLNPEYKHEYDRTKLANDVALQVLAYRAKHGMSQAELARRLGMRQPNIARLETGEHEPSLSTLARLSLLGIDFSVDIKAGGLKLRKTPPPGTAAAMKGAYARSNAFKAVKAASGRQSGRERTPSRSPLAPAARHSRKMEG